MFQHILLPVDGSDLSHAATRRCMDFAAGVGARVLVLHVVPNYHLLDYRPEVVSYTEGQYMQESQAQATRVLEHARRVAGESGVPCETLQVSSDDVHKAIIDTAGERGCDLICMASHGRKGMQGLLLGSVTHKVLVHGKLPVLVFR